MTVLTGSPREDTDTDPHWREDYVTAEAEMGTMQLNTEEHHGLPATTRSYEKARKDPSLEPSEGAGPPLTL